MRQAPGALARLIEEALARLRLPASQIVDQLSGGQVAPAGPGSPGVVDLDAIPTISGDDPQPLGAVAPGTSGEASDAGHVHPMPDAADVGAEPALGNPGTDGYVLASLAGGTRLWVPQSGGAPLSDATPQAPGTAAPGTGTEASRDDHVHAPPSAGQISDLLETTQDTVAAMLAAGANISLTYDDGAGTLTISVSGVPSHASSHASGGGDPLAPADIGAVAKSGDTMTGTLTLVSPAASALEVVMHASVSDDPGSYFQVSNATTSSGVFIPTFKFKNSAARTAGFFVAEATTDTGSEPVLIFDARQPSAALATRPMVEFRSYGGVKLRLGPTGIPYLFGVRTAPASPASGEVYRDSSGFLKIG